MVEFPEGKSLWASAYQASMLVTFADVLLAKRSHVTKPRVSKEGDYRRIWISGSVINWEPLINNMPHEQYI